MREHYFFRVLEIGDGTCDPEDPEIRSSREIQALDRFFEKCVAFAVEKTVYGDLLIGKLGIDRFSISRKSLGLAEFCGFDPRSVVFARTRLRFARVEFFDLDTGHAEKQIDTIEDRSRKF